MLNKCSANISNTKKIVRGLTGVNLQYGATVSPPAAVAAVYQPNVHMYMFIKWTTGCC